MNRECEPVGRTEELDDPQLAALCHSLGAAASIELAISPVDVCLDSVDRDDKLLSNLLIRCARGDQGQDFDLSLTKRFGH